MIRKNMTRGLKIPDTVDSCSTETIPALTLPENRRIVTGFSHDLQLPSNVVGNTCLSGPSQSNHLSFQEDIKLWALPIY